MVVGFGTDEIEARQHDHAGQHDQRDGMTSEIQ